MSARKRVEPENFLAEPDQDPLFEEVKKIVIETKKASASFLQRRLRIGYSRAARLIDMLEEQELLGRLTEQNLGKFMVK